VRLSLLHDVTLDAAVKKAGRPKRDLKGTIMRGRWMPGIKKKYV
jgi:hypothetical protein